VAGAEPVGFEGRVLHRQHPASKSHRTLGEGRMWKPVLG
jgi:hypothetical protein